MTWNALLAEQFEQRKEHLRTALEYARGSVSLLARDMDVRRQEAYDLLARHGLREHQPSRSRRYSTEVRRVSAYAKEKRRSEREKTRASLDDLRRPRGIHPQEKWQA